MSDIISTCIQYKFINEMFYIFLIVSLENRGGGVLYLKHISVWTTVQAFNCCMWLMAAILNNAGLKAHVAGILDTEL